MRAKGILHAIFLLGLVASACGKGDLDRSSALIFINKACYSDQPIWMHLATKFEQGQSTFLFDKKFNYRKVLAALSKSGAISEPVSLYNPEPKVEQIGIDQFRRENAFTIIAVDLRNVSGKPVRVVVSVSAINSRKDYYYRNEPARVTPVKDKKESQLGPNETQRIRFDLWVGSCCGDFQTLSDIKLGYQAFSLYPQEAYQLRLRESQTLRLQTDGLYALVGHFSAKEVTGITPEPNDTAARRVEYTLTTRPAGLGISRGKGDLEIQVAGRPEADTFRLREKVQRATLRLYDDGWRVTNCDKPGDVERVR